MTTTQDQERRLKLWSADLEAAKKKKEDWEKEYDCAILEAFVLGAQRGDQHDEAYIVNLCKPTMLARLASIVFPYPKTTVSSRPSKEDDPMTEVEDRSNVLEDTADFLCRDEKAGYKMASKLALIDAHYRFGIIESGYDMDMISNPNAGKTIVRDSDGKAVVEPDEIPRSPAPYFRWIPSETFFVPATSDNTLERCEWSGYYQWERLDMVKANKNYKNTSDLEATGMDNSYGDPGQKDSSGNTAFKAGKGRTKVWHIWNHWEKKKYVFPDACDRFFVDGEVFKTYPHSDYRGFHILGQFYPTPIASDWIDSQLEINERREQERVHAKHNNQLWTAIKGKLEESEQAKLENSQDNTLIWVKAHTDIQTVPRAGHDASVQIGEEKARRDFAEITNVGAEARQAPQESTATAAAISEQRLRAREEDERTGYSETLASTIKKMLLLTIEKRGLPLWIKINADRSSSAFETEKARITHLWKQINLKKYEGIEFDMELGIESMPPDTSDSNKNRWSQLIPLIATPATATLFALSPFLLRYVMRMYNVRGERILNEIRGVLTAIYKTEQAQKQIEAFVAGSQGAGNAGGGGGAAPADPGVPKAGASALTPVSQPASGVTSDETLDQLASQMGMPIGGES